jgi:hypothetical protein
MKYCDPILTAKHEGSTFIRWKCMVRLRVSKFSERNDQETQLAGWMCKALPIPSDAEVPYKELRQVLAIGYQN